jgi:hypothetical protein
VYQKSILGVRSVMPMMVLRPFVLHRVDSGSASPQPWRVQGMLSTWCAAPRVVADFATCARFAPPRHSTMTNARGELGALGELRCHAAGEALATRRWA